MGLGIALAAVATVVWSGSFVTSRALHDSVPPVQQAFWRWIVALAALAPFAARAAWRQRRVLRRHLGFLLLASLLGIAAYNTLVNQAALSTSAGTMGMIMAASPVLMAVYERVGGVRLGVRRMPLLADPLDVALPADHALVGAAEVRLADLAGEAWIFGGSGPWSDITRGACEAAGFAPRQGHSAAGWTAILAMVGAGMGVALVPRMAVAGTLAARGDGVAMRALDADRPWRHVVAAVRRGGEGAPAVACVLDALRAEAGALTARRPG
ncbi:LysR substrate-binding domain-containing protein [Streptomyces sp. NPDC058694]|uniref:LysR substrate-binding domain-containing protein n=1 Tax=Streptomyces sp. NPDC058694 TaxID=3346603 RepID=UPI003668D443